MRQTRLPRPILMADVQQARTAFFERIWVDADTGCWIWIGAKGPRGYGHFFFGGKNWRAPRFAYALEKGDVPSHLEIDHLCLTHGCVNPNHLELVTHAENVRRGRSGEVNGGRNRNKTHCKHGHPFSGDNLSIRTSPNGGTQRICLECTRTAAFAAAARKRAKKYAGVILPGPDMR